MTDFDKPDCILFDLDSTLYSVRLGLEKSVSRRVNRYIAEYLGLPPEEAWALRKERVTAAGYGTTLEWLRAEKNFNDPHIIDEYFAFIHPEDEADGLGPDPHLRSLLLDLSESMTLAILTNSPEEHAERILAKLGIADLFPSIFGIRGNGLKGKPRPEVFRRALDSLKSSPRRCVFVDDVRRYAEFYRNMGGHGIFFDELNEHPEFPPPRIRRLDELPGVIEGIRSGS
ncbi:MAG: HAD-IA family hydrolase [Treponema sp.]|jgi:putative hydrolase of the HAD superfamily|nr:HAD-IA family hydrolase [Treponema sp.]